MNPLNIVAESLKSLGIDSRAIAQATGISEPNLTTIAPSKKCANAPSLGALFAESPDPGTAFERMLKEGTPGFSTDERLAVTIQGLSSALRMAEGMEDPQARLAVIVRAVQLAERAGVSKTRQEAAQAFAAWIAGVYLRGISGGSTKLETELRVELATVTEQRDEAMRKLDRALLSNDCLDEAHKAEIGKVASIFGAKEGESLEDAAKRVVNAEMLGGEAGASAVEVAQRVVKEREELIRELRKLTVENGTLRDKLESAAVLLDTLAKTLGRKMGEGLDDTAVRVMGERQEAMSQHDADKELIETLRAERDSLRAEVTMLRTELATEKDARKEDGKELAELAIELGQQAGETLIAAARRVRQSDTQAEVERLKGVCEHHAERLRQKHDEIEAIAKAIGEHDGMTDVEAVRAVMTERDELRSAQKHTGCCWHETARKQDEVLRAVTDERDALRQKLSATQAELHILSKAYDEALELCDRDGMTPTEQIKELRKELEDIRPEAEQMAGWRQSSLNRQVEIQNLQAALAEEKKQRQDFVVALCAELGVEGGERTVMTALEQLKSRVGPKAIVIPHRMEDMASAGLVRALPLLQPCDAAPSSEASHITQAGEVEVKKALTRPADSNCTCHLNAPCSHCTWYADRGMDGPGEAPDSGKPSDADGGLVMID